jgi:hypothetical protein
VLIESYICEIPDLVRACCIGKAHDCIYSWNDTILPSTLLSLIASGIKLLIYSWLSYWPCNRFISKGALCWYKSDCKINETTKNISTIWSPRQLMIIMSKVT